MLSLMPFTPSYAIFYAIYPKLCYLLCHIPRSSAIFFLKVMLQYIILTPSYANSSYAMFSGQSWGRISGHCCTEIFSKTVLYNVVYNCKSGKMKKSKLIYQRMDIIQCRLLKSSKCDFWNFLKIEHRDGP